MRRHSVLTKKKNLEHLDTIKRFPVYMGCVSNSKNKDVFRDLTFDICKDTGVIQLRNTLPLNLTNPYPHNDSVGNIWKLHNDTFADFIKKFRLKRVMEIGGGSGKLAHLCLKGKRTCTWDIYDKNYFGEKHDNIKVKYEWFDENSDLSKYDAIIHSHVLEHIHNQEDFLSILRKKVNKKCLHIFSLPNLYEWLKKKYVNCLNFEHTVFLTEEILDTMLKRTGFEVVEKYAYQDHSIFYACKPCEPEEVQYKNNYKKYKKIYTDHIQYYQKIVKKINDSKKKYKKTHLFGAHIFSQYLIASGLDLKNVDCILDNSTLKIGNRLYGTSLKVNSPEVLREEEKPLVILLAGVYSKEIKDGILKNVNRKTKFLP